MKKPRANGKNQIVSEKIPKMEREHREQEMDRIAGLDARKA